MLEHRACVYYDNSTIDPEFEVYPICEMLFNVVDPNIISSRIKELKVSREYMDEDHRYFRLWLIEIYRALLDNMQEGKNLDFIRRRWPDGI